VNHFLLFQHLKVESRVARLPRSLAIGAGKSATFQTITGSKRMKILGSSVLLGAAFLATPAWSAVDMFLRIETTPGSYISGESTDKAFKGWSDVLAWSWGLSNGSSGASGAFLQDFSWTQYQDTSLVPVFLGVANGTSFESATLKVRSAGVDPLVFFEMKFLDVHLTSLSTGSSGGEDKLTSNTTLSYSGVTMTYTPRDSKTGGGLKPIVGTFSLNPMGAVGFSGDANVLTGLFQAGGAVALDAIPSPVPEPETYAMLLAGLGLLGCVVRRRKKAAA
jgi:type VI secretion system secreted protein Hcp